CSVSDKGGNPISINGYVKDDKDSIAAIFNTSSDGLGKFILFPGTKNRKYIAFIQWNSKVLSFPLPRIVMTSYQLALVQADTQQLKFRIGLGDSVYNNKTISYLIGESHGRIYYAATGSGMYEASIPRKDLPRGLVSFYLYNELKQQVSARKIFNNYKELHVDFLTNKKKYTSRERVRLSLTIKNREEKPTQAMLSIAVTDNRYIQWPLSQ